MSVTEGAAKTASGGGGRRKQLMVAELESGLLERWSRLVTESPQGSAYSLPGYLEAICSATGGRYRILGAMRGEELVGGIALYERSSPAGPFVAPRLLLYYNGFVLRDYQTRYPSERSSRQVETITALAEALEQRGYGRLEVRSRS